MSRTRGWGREMDETQAEDQERARDECLNQVWEAEHTQLQCADKSVPSGAAWCRFWNRFRDYLTRRENAHETPQTTDFEIHFKICSSSKGEPTWNATHLYANANKSRSGKKPLRIPANRFADRSLLHIQEATAEETFFFFLLCEQSRADNRGQVLQVSSELLDSSHFVVAFWSLQQLLLCIFRQQVCVYQRWGWLQNAS